MPLPCLLLPMTPGVSQTTSLGDADVLRLQGQRRRWRSLHGPQVAPQERCFAPAALRTPTLRFPRAAFRVCNQFEAVRSDGVLQTGSPTDMRGFSVSRDFITATVYLSFSLVRRSRSLSFKAACHIPWYRTPSVKPHPIEHY